MTIKVTDLQSGGNTFKATSLGTSQNYELSAATSPLILTPPAGKVIRLDALTTDDIVIGVSIEVGGNVIVAGDMRATSKSIGTFDITSNTGNGGSSTNNTYFTGSKEPIIATQPDESIAIYCTEASTNTVYYSVSYGDLV